MSSQHRRSGHPAHPELSAPLGASEGLGVDRRRFLIWMARIGAFAVVGAGLPSWARGQGAPAQAGSLIAGTKAPAETARAWRTMGTLIEVRVPDLPPAEAVEAIRTVRRRVEALEAAMTLFRPESPLVAFNRSPAGAWTNVPGDLAGAVAASVRAVGETEGSFDPTVAPAMRAWGLYTLEGREAGARFLRTWPSRTGIGAVEVDVANRRIRRFDPRVEVDLGGIGKGIAVDEALAILHAAGSRAALVNLGGSIGVLGAPPDAPEGWTVGIADPRNPGAIVTEFPLASGHVATSGDYERWVPTPRGRRHHILDPGTGDSARGVASITVRGSSGLEADVLSTARFVAAGRGVRHSPDPHLILAI